MPNQKSPHSWSTAANQNNDADATIPRPEGMSAGRVNNMDRAEMAAHKAHLIDSTYGTLTTGSATSYALALEQNITNLQPGMRHAWTAHATNTGPATFDAGGTGQIELLRHSGEQLEAGDILEGLYYQSVVDDNGSHRLINPVPAEAAPPTIPFDETVDPEEVATVVMAAASDEYNHTQTFEDSKALVIVSGQWSALAASDSRENLHKLQLMYIDEDDEAQELSTILYVGQRMVPFAATLEADYPAQDYGNNTILQGPIFLAAELNDTNMRTGSAWRVVLYAGKEDSNSDRTRVDWSRADFIPKM